MPGKRLKSRPIIALVGRANVGKSTLWNRLTETGRAIVSKEAHTTRDRNYAPIIWRGLSIDCVDTGGMDADQGSEIGRGIRNQAELAVKEADLVLFIVDARSGVIPVDVDFAKKVKHLNKNVLLVVNKMDTPQMLGEAYTKEMMAMGMGEPVNCSASTGKGTGDLLDRVFKELEKRNKHPQPIEDANGLKIVIMGRPNVGKSSIVNGILGEERVVVSPEAHTTREPIDTTFDWNNEHFTLIDTAGMRKRSRIDKGIEEESIEKNRAALHRADIAFLVFDASEAPTQQDKHLAGLMHEESKGLLLIANKWDLVKNKTTKSTDEYELAIRRAFPFLHWADIVFVSAHEHQRMDRLLELALRIREERRRVISHNALQRLLKTVVARKKPLADGGTFTPYLHEVTQTKSEPPTFLISVRGEKAAVHKNWIHYFENRLREKFGFRGTPIVVKVELLPMRSVEDRNPNPINAKLGKDGKKINPWRRKRPIGRKGNRY